eukprot:Clim_evm89s11 gene=Clim_evmTU89s11
MVKVGLYFNATLTNVTDLQPDGEDFNYMFKVQCGNCGEESEKFVGINKTETFELPGSRGEANFVYKCKLCSRQSSIDILPDTVKPYTEDHSGSPACILVMDCRGIEPVVFEVRDGWKCKGAETGTPFEDVDLTEGDWAEYDEKNNEPTMISDIESEFRTVK